MGSLLDHTVACKPRLHRAGGPGYGLGSQDVWTTKRLLECERGWRRCSTGWILSSLKMTSSITPPWKLHWQTTASDSTLTAIVAARAWYLSEHPGTSLESLVIYVTSQTHSAGLKAGMILGLRVRALDVDVAVVADNTGLTGEGLITAVKEDHARGLHPFVFSEYFFARIFRRFAKTSYSCYDWNDIVRRH